MDWGGLHRGEYDAFLRAAADAGCPVFLNLSYPLPDAFLTVVRQFRTIPFVIDHLGTGSAPPVQPAGDEPFRHLEEVLEFAEEPNVYVKLSSAPALSKEIFPFRDIWTPVLELVKSYGANRTMWGSDFTRTNCLYSYRHGLEYLWHMEGLGDDDRAWIVGGTVRQLLALEHPHAG
jgi:predicted TIM-barrel fold metal-dependent hydrolase